MKDHNLVAPCGDYCGGCAQYNGSAVTMAKHMRELADLYGFDVRSQGAFDFKEFLKGLEWFIAQGHDFPCSRIEEVADSDTMDRCQRFRNLGLDAWVAEQAQRAEQGYEIHLRKVVSLKRESSDRRPS
jgi:hypothetical protein